MNFGKALEALKAGQKVARTGWNGKNMWLQLETLFTAGGRMLKPCIVMRTAQGEDQPGWLASQADMLADDWVLVE